jgi:hypothetical protein
MPTSPRPPGAHPLDLIPLFRRWPDSLLRNLVYTGIWSSMIGLALTAVQALNSRERGFIDLLPHTLVVANLVGYMIHGGLIGLNTLLRGWPRRLTGLLRLAYYVVTVSTLVLGGIVIGSALTQGRNPLPYMFQLRALLPLLPFALATAVFMYIVSAAGRRRAEADLQAAQQREDIAATAQMLAEARLRALQAQIEPHFLYNTLANVLSLIDSQPAQARHMLERFIDFLRASLHASRADHATVGAEFDLAAAYLDVLRVRMGERLRYRIDADPQLRALAIAPMLIQPLVENAVMHGLEPKIEGGTIVLAASLLDGALCVEVRDDGVGIGNAPARAGGGVGLANLKARVRSLHAGQSHGEIHGESHGETHSETHGEAHGQVQLLDNPGGGAIVRLLLPLT